MYGAAGVLVIVGALDAAERQRLTMIKAGAGGGMVHKSYNCLNQSTKV